MQLSQMCRKYYGESEIMQGQFNAASFGLWLLMAKMFSPLLVLIFAAVVLLAKDAVPSDSDEGKRRFPLLVILSVALFAAFSLSWTMWPAAEDLVFGPISAGNPALQYG